MLEIRNININYNQNHILSTDTFKAPTIGICAIFGESGSGKSSLLKSILLEERQFDDYLIKEKSIKDFESFKRDYLSSLSQSSVLIDDLSIKNHFDLFDDEKKKTRIIQSLKLTKLLKKYPPQLSGGEKTRVGFALAILRDQPILVLDEPTASLDKEMADVIIKLIKEYSKEHLVIISTHDRSILEIADVIYQIKDKQLHSIKYEEKEGNVEITKKINFSSFKRMNLYFDLKKRKKLYHITMTLLLILSITFTSFGLSKIIHPTQDDNQLDTIYDNDIFVYKMIDKEYHPQYSNDGSEFPFSESEINQIQSIEHVSQIKNNYLVNMTDYILIPEENLDDMTHYSERWITLYDENGNPLLSDYYPQDIYNNGAGTTLSIYFEEYNYESDIAIKTEMDNGWYISKALLEQFNITINTTDQLYLEVDIIIPTLNGYNDAMLGTKTTTWVDEDGVEWTTSTDYIPLCRLLGVSKTIKLPISGVLNANSMGVNTGGEQTSIFMPSSIFESLVEEYKEPENVDYHYVESDEYYGYKRVEEENFDGNVMHCEPYQPLSLIVTVDNNENKKAVISELEDLGFTPSATVSNLFASKFQSNTEENLFYASSGALILIMLIYFIIQYLNIKKERQIPLFFSQIGFNKKEINKIIFERYIFEFLLVCSLSLFTAFSYFYIIMPILIDKLGAPLFSAYYSYIPIIIILSFIITFIYPFLLHKRK